MRSWKRGAALLCLLLALLCAGCAGTGTQTAPEEQPDQETLDRELDAQLGLLAGAVTQEERQEAMELWKLVRELRTKRLDRGEYQWSRGERELLEQLNSLYEEYTIRYLEGDELGWGYANPREYAIASYRIQGGEQITLMPDTLDLSHGPWTQEELEALWQTMRDMLPEGAFTDFIRFYVFTDGEGETMAYVMPRTSSGKKWEIYVDPADSDDGEVFIETVLHEYCHYLTLNDSQVTYTWDQTVDTYNEEGMVSLPGSYLDDFYQRFWADYLDDRLVNMDSYNFFLRHDYDFVTDYASTDPSEDICESFTYFVLRDRAQGDEVWEQKLNFFYDYPELVEFRLQVRENLELEESAR